MLRGANPSRRVLRRVAREVAIHWTHPVFEERRRTGSPGRTPRAIAETLELWTIDKAAMRNAPSSSTLEEIARPTSRWHHQIVENGHEPIAFARSSRHAGALGTKVELVRSRLATKIAEAATWLDDHVKRRATVRLLEIPSELVEALWVVPDARTSPSGILVVSAPERLRLPRNRLIGARALITAVRKQTPTPT